MDRMRLVRILAVLCMVCLSFGMIGGVIRSDTMEMRPVGTLSVAVTEIQAEEEAPAPTETPVPATPTPTDDPGAEPPLASVEAPAKSCFCNDSYTGSYLDVDGVPYVCVQGIFAALDEGTRFDIEDSCLRVELDGLELRVFREEPYFICNGRYLYMPQGSLWREDGVYVPAQELAKCFGGSLELDVENEQLYIIADEIVPLASGSEFYGEEDLYWLSHVIYAEAGIESLEGQIAVGNVVLNRVASDVFDDQLTIYDVIFAEGQFDVVRNGTIYLEPTEEAVLAAKIALEGYGVVPGALFFAQSHMGPAYVILEWIGVHCFMTLA